MAHEGVLLCLGVGGGGKVHEWRGGAGELTRDLSWGTELVWVDWSRVLVILLAHWDILECLLLRSRSVSLCCIFAESLLLLLSHLEEYVKEAEGGDDEDEEEVHDLEGNVPLSLKVIPLVLDVFEIVLGFLNLGLNLFGFRLDRLGKLNLF